MKQEKGTRGSIWKYPLVNTLIADVPLVTAHIYLVSFANLFWIHLIRLLNNHDITNTITMLVIFVVFPPTPPKKGKKEVTNL